MKRRSYPARVHRTGRIRDVRENTPEILTGRLIVLSEDGRGGILRDGSGSIPVALQSSAADELREGDIVELSGQWNGERFSVYTGRLLAPSLHGMPSPASCTPNWLRLLQRDQGWELLHLRAEVLHHIRMFFRDRGFLEVDTPVLLPYPNVDAHVRPMESTYLDARGTQRRMALHTSPEYPMKKLLTAGAERIVQVAHVFRNGEQSAFHNPEFTLLEWYRAYASYIEIMEDTEHLIAYIVEQLYGEPHLTFQGQAVDLTPPWERITVEEAFRREADVDLKQAQDEIVLRRIALQKGYLNVDGADWEILFHRIFLQEVEPSLGRGRPTFLLDYPDRLSAMAKCKEGALRWAERCELYVAGMELANGYTELNDPEEQRARLTVEQARKRREGYNAPIDEELLYALEQGMPPSGGIALGVDRLLMLLADRTTIQEVIAFPFAQMTDTGPGL